MQIANSFCTAICTYAQRWIPCTLGQGESHEQQHNVAVEPSRQPMETDIDQGPSLASNKRVKHIDAAVVDVFPEGQTDIILHILSFLPSSHQAAVGKLVCKAAYRKFQQHRLIKASACAELPMECFLRFLQHREFRDSTQRYRLDLMAAVARQGDLERFQLLQQRGCNWDASVCLAAAEGGQIAILQWLKEQGPPCPWGPELCIAAARGGQLQMLQWLRAQNPPCPWDQRTCRWAARNGHMHVLQWARAQRPRCPWDARVTCDAVKRGNLERLQQVLALKPPAPWQPRVGALAAEHGHLHILKWLAEKKPDLNWKKDRCLVLARHKKQDAVVAWLESLPADHP